MSEITVKAIEAAMVFAVLVAPRLVAGAVIVAVMSISAVLMIGIVLN